MNHSQPAESQNRRILKRTLLIVSACGVVALVLLVVVGIAGALFLQQAAGRIDIDEAAVTTAVEEAVVITLRDGSDQQKLDTIAELAKLGPDAKSFVPALIGATDDPNPTIRKAASDALGRIDPEWPIELQ